MKRILPFFILILICQIKVFAQSSDWEKLSSDSKTPSSPAYSILGINPTEVARPKDFSAFETSLFNSLTNSSSVAIPDNLAIELMPYWMVGKTIKGRTISDVVDGKKTFAKNFSISLATNSVKDTLTNSSSKQIGIGLRSMILQPSKLTHEFDSVTNLFRNYEKSLVRINQIVNYYEQPEFATEKFNIIQAKSLLNKAIQGAYADDEKICEATNALVTPILNKIFKNDSLLIGNEIAKRLKPEVLKSPIYNKAKELPKISRKYYGWGLEIATGMAFDFPGNEFKDGDVGNLGLWSTLSYIPDSSFLFVNEFNLLFKYQSKNLTNETKGIFDMGVRLNSYLSDRFTLSAEYIFRTNGLTFQKAAGNQVIIGYGDADHKAVLNLSYKLNENFLLSYSFGKGFNIGNANGNMISLASLSFALSPLIKK